MEKARKITKIIWENVPYSIPIIVAIGFIVFLFVINPPNEPVPLQPRQITTNIVHICVTGDTRQRTVQITIQETGQRATITTTTRTVIRRRSATTAPSAPRQTVHHDGNIIRIYSVNNILVIHEIESDRRHYI